MADPGLRILEVLGSSGGGVIRHVRSIAAGLVEAGDDVVVAGPGDLLGGGRLSSVENPGYRVADVPISDRPRPRRDLSAVLALRRLARDRDLVHAHGLRAGALAVLAVRSVWWGPVRWRPVDRRPVGGRPRIAVTLHNLPVGGGLVAVVSAVLERIVTRGADVVLGVSPDLVDRARRRGAREVDLALVPAPPGPGAARIAGPATSDLSDDRGDGLADDRGDDRGDELRAEVRAELGVPPGEALVVAAARLAPQKGLDLLADALAILCRRPAGAGVTAVVAGDGPLRRRLTDEARARGLPLHLVGDRDDVPRLFAAADAVVLTSLWEGQSLAVQEALRAGAALVLTDVGGNRAVAGDAAVLVPRTDPVTSARDFAAALAHVLDDPVFAADLRRRALARAQELPTEADAVRQVQALAERRDTPA